MTLVVSPDYGVEIPPDVRYMDLRERAEAACQTINLLEEHGLEVNPTEEDRASTTVLVEAYAKDEERCLRR